MADRFIEYDLTESNLKLDEYKIRHVINRKYDSPIEIFWVMYLFSYRRLIPYMYFSDDPICHYAMILFIEFTIKNKGEFLRYLDIILDKDRRKHRRHINMEPDFDYPNWFLASI